MRAKKRMLDPIILSHPVLKDDRLFRLYTALHFLTDDSCCIRLDRIEKDIGWHAFPFGGVSESEVSEMINTLDKANLIWKYKSIEGHGTQCAYLPEARSFSAVGRGVWNEPEDVPLPKGITYDASGHSNHKGRGHYTFPNTREQLIGSYTLDGEAVFDEVNLSIQVEQGAQGAQVYE